MKKIIFPVFILMVIAFTGCTKDYLELPGDNEDPNLKKKDKNVFVVLPSGGDDTEALLQAFADAQATGSYATVKLVAGEYHVGLIEIHSFFGSFIGAGKDVTIILPTPNLPVANSNESNVLPAWFKFIAGDLIISHMTFTVPDGLPCQDPVDGWFATDLYTILDLADFTEHYRPETRYLKARIEHVSFIGGSDNGEGGYWKTTHNTLLGIWIGIDFWWGEAPEYTMMVGDVSISHCYFENFLNAFEYSHMRNSKGVVSHNVIKDIWTGIYLNYLIESKMDIFNNKFYDNTYGDILVDDNDWWLWEGLVAENSTKYNIFGNHMKQMKEVSDVPENPYGYPTSRLSFLETQPIFGFSESVPFADFNVWNNHIDVSEDVRGIWGWNTQNSLIEGNKFKGYGSYGIYLEGTEDPEIFSEYNSLLYNKFSPADFSEANVYLGTYTRYNTVIGNTPEETIIDEGENNNIKVFSKKTLKNKTRFDGKEYFNEFYKNHYRNRK